MADKNKFEQMAWFQRAIDKSIPTTEANETIRTSSFEQDGVIYLVECGKEPTVICYSHALLYTLGSILFTLGSILWLKVG